MLNQKLLFLLDRHLISLCGCYGALRMHYRACFLLARCDENLLMYFLLRNQLISSRGLRRYVAFRNLDMILDLLSFDLINFVVIAQPYLNL
jgi:hypothetical protein